MNKRQFGRRELLRWASFATAATALSSFSIPFWKRSTLSPLRVGIGDWLPAPLIADLEQGYLRHLSVLTGRNVEVLLIPTLHLLNHSQTSTFDLVISSPNFHHWLHPEHRYFGSLPFGMNANQKKLWLTSGEGVAFQKKYFHSLGFRPQAIALGGDLVGAFARSEEDLHALAQTRIAERENPLEQAQEIQHGRRTQTELLTPDVALYLAEQGFGPFTKDLKFYLFPEAQTAPVIFALWSQTAWKKVSSVSEPLDELASHSLFEASKAWSLRQERSLDLLKTHHPVLEGPVEIRRQLQSQALLAREKISQRHPFARTLHEAYTRFSSKFFTFKG